MNRTIDEIKALVIFMKEQGAYKFSVDDVSVEFGIGSSVGMKIPTTIDDEEERAQALRDVLKQAISDEQADLAWSV